ncbi:MAG: DUF808 domain-containing protein [Burkholderiaceae bacterium]|nr:DUF808 domain-containing protein [Burkholderiaceae bacterium]
MAGASLLTLLDDIATILDDVALMTKMAAKSSAAAADDVSLMTKVAAQKTAGVLGDDLALNAQQVAGVRAERELPVVWAVAKGSMLNKLILVPAALLISALMPWAITPLLMLGGAFLCFEGFEKIAHPFLHGDEPADTAAPMPSTQTVDWVAFEKNKIQGAVRTDFILSAEIVTIALGTVAAAPFGQQVAVLAAVAIAMTVGVYGLVAGIVKLDDVGLWLTQKPSRAAQALGRGMLHAAPWLMKTLAVVGTAAMFLVGGGILAHGVPALHHGIESAGAMAGAWPLGGLWQVLTTSGLNGVLGILAGALVLAGTTLVQRLRPRASAD